MRGGHGCPYSGAGGGSFILSPFSQLEELTCGVWITTYMTKSFSLPKFCLDAKNSSSPFEVRHPLLGGQREHTCCNTQNKDTFPSRSQGSGSHTAKHTQHSASAFPGQLHALRR